MSMPCRAERQMESPDHDDSGQRDQWVLKNPAPRHGLSPCRVHGFHFRRDQNMADLQQLKATILADGVIDDEEVAIIRKELYADGKIDKDEVEFLVALRNEAKK